MATWRIDKCYGRGAARVVLAGAHYRSDLDAISFSEGMRLAGPDVSRAARSGLFWVSLLMIALLVTVGRTRQDMSSTQIFVFREAPPPKPEAPPIPEARPRIQPPPQPVAVEHRPAPPPPAPAPESVIPPEPAPIQLVEATPPPAVEIPVTRPRPELKRPRPRPRIELAALAAQPVPASPEPQPRRTNRAARPEATRRESKKPALMLNAASLKPLDTAELDAPAATSVRSRPLRRSEQSTRSIRPSLVPAAVLPDERDRVATPSTRTRRPQLASLPRSAPARVAFAPVRTESTLNGDGSLRAARSSRTRATSPPRSSTRRVRPQLEPGPATIPSEPDSHLPRASRAQRIPAAPMREARSASRVSFAAATRLPEASATRESSLPRSRRAELVNEPGSRQRAGTEGAGLSGVPLAELASCVTDREEARLKQRVLAAVTSQEKCASPAGTYRFVETKNLNAFLMWIERAPGQPSGDRCVALRNALACLESNP